MRRKFTVNLIFEIEAQCTTRSIEYSSTLLVVAVVRVVAYSRLKRIVADGYMYVYIYIYIHNLIVDDRAKKGVLWIYV